MAAWLEKEAGVGEMTPREQGRWAFRKGRLPADNPYMSFTHEHDLWKEGWDDERAIS